MSVALISARSWTAEQISVAAHQFTDGTMKQAEQEVFTQGPMKQNPKLREAVQGLWRQQLVGDYARGNMTPAASTLFKRKFLTPGNPMNLIPDLRIVQIGLIKVERTKLEFALEDEVLNYTAGNMTRDEQTAFETRMTIDDNLRKLVEAEEDEMDAYQDTLDYVRDTMTPARKTEFEARMARDADLKKLVEEESATQRISDYIDDTMDPDERATLEEEMSSDEQLRASVDRERIQAEKFLKILREHSARRTGGRNKSHLRRR